MGGSGADAGTGSRGATRSPLPGSTLAQIGDPTDQILTGGELNDTVFGRGGTGFDYLLGGEGNGAPRGGAGDDTLVLQDVEASRTYTEQSDGTIFHIRVEGTVDIVSVDIERSIFSTERPASTF